MKVKKLLDEFDDAAQNWGWQRDLGVGGEIGKSKVKYIKTYDQLLKYIELLENKIKKGEK